MSRTHCRLFASGEPRNLPLPPFAFQQRNPESREATCGRTALEPGSERPAACLSPLFSCLQWCSDRGRSPTVGHSGALVGVGNEERNKVLVLSAGTRGPGFTDSRGNPRSLRLSVSRLLQPRTASYPVGLAGTGVKLGEVILIKFRWPFGQKPQLCLEMTESQLHSTDPSIPYWFAGCCYALSSVSYVSPGPLVILDLVESKFPSSDSLSFKIT